MGLMTAVCLLVALPVLAVGVILYENGAPAWVVYATNLVASLAMFPAANRWERWHYHRRQARKTRRKLSSTREQ